MSADEDSALRPAEVAADLESLRRDGYVILPKVISQAQIEGVRGDLEPWLDRTPLGVGDFHGWRTTRVNGLLGKVPAVCDLVMHPRILAIANALLLPSCDCTTLNLTQAICVHPGERAQVPHRDEEMWPVDHKGANWAVNVMWAIDDFTEENGATRLWPGSHTRNLARDAGHTESIAAEMPKGSALIYLGSLTHAAGANQSPSSRTGIVVSYCLGWLRTYENQYLAYPRDVVRSFSPELQRLIGYRMHRPNLGSCEGQDPIWSLSENVEPAPHEDALTPELEAQLRAYYAEREDERS